VRTKQYQQFNPRILGVTLAVLVAFLLASCSPPSSGSPSSSGSASSNDRQQSGIEVRPYVEYKPPFLPIKFVYDKSGISVAGDLSFVTPLGTFTMGASAPIVAWDEHDLPLILRDRQHRTDTMYMISGGENAQIIANGRATIEVNRDRVVVEVLEGHVIEVKSPGDRVRPVPSGQNEPLNCFLQKGEKVHARDNARAWRQPNVLNSSVSKSFPTGATLYIVGGPERGPIRRDYDYSGWWWLVSESPNGNNIGWVWEGRIAECNYSLQ
jgi:hypothetical protein